MYNIRKGARAMPGPVRRTCACGLVYELVYKRVKNVNFRVRADGTMAVSAPRCVSAARRPPRRKTRCARSARQP